MLSILEQHERICADGEGDIICPDCGQEIGQFYGWFIAAECIEKDACPMCSCNHRWELHAWCKSCRNEYCEQWKEVHRNRRWADEEI